MAKKTDRSSKYYLDRLQREHPGIYTDWKAGRYLSINAALRDAGLINSRTRLHELKNAWAKASATERRQFFNWVTSGSAITGAPPTPSPVDVDRRLQDWAKVRIEEIIAKRGMKMGAVMAELRFKRKDPSLGQALRNGWRIDPKMATALEKWLHRNKSV